MSYALIISCLLFLGAENDPILFEEGFDGKLQNGWKWIREDPNEWQIVDGVLQMRSQPGAIWGGNNAKNVLLIQPTSTDHVEARVHVTHAPKNLWEQAGLLWYVDDDNFVKLISEQIEGKIYAVLAYEQEGRGTVSGKVVSPQPNMQLRLVVESGKVTGQWRIRETDIWSDCGICEFNAKKKKGAPRFGLFTQTGPKEEIRWVRFDSFVILKTTCSE